ncbi:MAG: pentapeptide repeat-containing protein [Cyanobacteriota bacterium]|nr:pentapeptide repeat-containing protein [Cyanobacteriota bacterium]
MSRGRWINVLFSAVMAMATPAIAADAALIQLLEKRSCPRCNLADADLVHADLRDANLQGSALQRANLSQARLDGARLNGADLSFTSLLGATLRGADLRGARLEGTDLRQADLNGALLDPGALSRSHWQQARGLPTSQLSYTDLHNAGVEAAQAGRFPEAERWFSDAIRRKPEAAISWVARGISRGEQGNAPLAAADLSYAASLYRLRGEDGPAQQLELAANALRQPGQRPRGGNGMGSQMLGGALTALKLLAPLAAKAFIPMGI